MSRELPEEFALLQSGKDYVDVIGPVPPWEIPQGWLESVRATVRRLNEDERSDVREHDRYVEGTREGVNFVFMAAGYLPAAATLHSGTYSDFPYRLVEDFVKPDMMPGHFNAMRYHYSYDLWMLFLLDWRISRNATAEQRQESIEISREIVSMFTDVPQMATRAKILVTAYDHILGDPRALELYRTGSWQQISAHFKNELAPETYTYFPEIGSPLDHASWAYQGWSAIHEALQVKNKPSQAFFIASWLRIENSDGVPAILRNVVGESIYAEVEQQWNDKDLPQTRDELFARIRRFMTEALLDGQLSAIRSWSSFALWWASCLNGLPGMAEGLDAVPAGFLVTDTRDIYRPRKITNPFVEQLRQNAETNNSTGGGNSNVPLRQRSDDDVPDELMDLDDNVEIGDPQADLEQLIGLGGIKEEVARLVAEARAEILRREAGMPPSSRSRHLVFTGNPGTAKTTVARIVARMYAQLGLLRRGHLVEVGRADLIGEYIGQTAPKVMRVADRAMGGVLFIDEAYALIPQDSVRDFGHEAVATLIKVMEDNRDDLVVIAAGYPNEMDRFLQSNPGVASRFPRTLNFDDYSDEELWRIFLLIVEQSGFVLGSKVDRAFMRLCPGRRRPKAFGNGRWVRNVFEEATSRQAERVVTLTNPTHEQIRTLEAVDFPRSNKELPDTSAQSGTGMYL